MQRCGGEEDFAHAAERAEDGSPDTILGAVAAAKFVGFVDHGDIPRDAAELILDLAGVLVEDDDDSVAGDRRRITGFDVERVGAGVENGGREVELLAQFEALLLAERRRADGAFSPPRAGRG